MRQFAARGSLPALLIENMRSRPSRERLQYATSNSAWGNGGVERQHVADKKTADQVAVILKKEAH
jgi:hypothetical protein